MKRLLILPLAMIMTSCITLPSLSEENKTLVKDVATYICAADKAGVLNEGGELTPEKINAIMTQLQNSNTNMVMPTLTPDQLQARMDAISNDPVQLALFAQALATEQTNCKAGNTNA